MSESLADNILLKKAAPISAAEYGAITQNCARRGELLAQKIYILSVVERITSVETYQDAIEECVRNQSSRDEILTLIEAKKYFESKYSAELTRKGVSTKLIDQIIHRVGKSNKALFEKLLSGFNSIELAKRLWDNRFSLDIQAIKHEIYELSNSQVAELRHEYQRIPRKLIAEELNSAILRKNSREISTPDFDTILLITKNRTLPEINLILDELCELYRVNPWDEINLAKIIEPEVSPENYERILELLNGFTVNMVSEKIEAIINNITELITERDEVNTIEGDFAGRFCRDYNSSEVWLKELLGHEFINENLFGLNALQIEEIAQALKTKGIELNLNLYQSNIKFDSRYIADNFFRILNSLPQRKVARRDEDYLSENEIKEVKQVYRLGSDCSLNELVGIFAKDARLRESENIMKRALSTLEYLNDLQLRQVKLSFAKITAMDLKDFITERCNYVSRNENSVFLDKLIEHRVGGILHLDLSPDMMDLFKEESKAVDSSLSEATEKLCQVIADLVKTDQNIELTSDKVTTLIRNVPINEFQALESAFYIKNNKRMALLPTLKKLLNARDFTEIRLLLSGFDSDFLATNLNQIDLLKLLNSTPSEIAALIAKLRAKGIDLYKHCLELDEPRHTKILKLAIANSVDILKLNKLLIHNDQLDDAESQKLMDLVGKSPDETMALRFCFNHWFTNRFRQFDYGFLTLVQRLKNAANLKTISRNCFARSILFLEGLSYDLAENLQAYLFTSNINSRDLDRVNNILRDYREDIPLLKKVYNSLDPGATLRERIHSLDIEFDHKNSTLLLMDGYDPENVVKEVHSLINKYSDNELGEKICSYLLTAKETPDNKHMPHQRNWIPEMYHQIRIKYENTYGLPLVSMLKKRGMTMSGANSINWLAYRLYGEISKSVVTLNHLLSQNREDTEFKINQLINDEIINLIPALKERFIAMFSAYYCNLETAEDIFGYIKRVCKSPTIIEKINSALIKEEENIALNPETPANPDILADILASEFGTG